MGNCNKKFEERFNFALSTKVLDLGLEYITDADLEDYIVPFLIQNPKVTILDLRFNKITDKGAMTLSKANGLSMLYLSGNQVTNMGVLYIICRNPGCEIDIAVPRNLTPIKPGLYECDECRAEERNRKSIRQIKMEIKSIQNEVMDEVQKVSMAMHDFEEILDSFHEYFWDKSRKIMDCIDEIERDLE